MADNSLAQRVEVDSKQLAKVVRALKRESDGKQLARDLVRGLRLVAEPALLAVRGAILSMDSHSEVEPGLRAAIARQTKISVRTTGRRAGVSIYSKKTGMPRNFYNAPKRLNEARGWRHPVFGHVTRWVTQRGRPGWFDDTLKPFREPGKEAASQALHAVARRIMERSKI